jgi:hypothetical protein
MNILMSYICYDIAVPDFELIKVLVTCKLQYQMIDSDAIDYRHCGEIRDFIVAFQELQERAYGNGSIDAPEMTAKVLKALPMLGVALSFIYSR